MVKLSKLTGWLLSAICVTQLMSPAFATSFVDVVKTLKPGVVGVGIYDPLGTPRVQLLGTGFVVPPGNLIATNQHVVNKALSQDSKQSWAVFAGHGERPRVLVSTIVATDEEHDLALLKMDVTLTPLTLGADTPLPDGSDIAITGFPIGSVLGLYPATHKGIVAAYSPVAIPTVHSQQLDVAMLKRLRDPFMVYQLDVVAYPGNSGSPVYNVHNGQVVGIVNKVFVKGTKETALTDPSGITYAIPVKYLKDMLKNDY
ncbi:serine protease [Aestuariibacter halophilus]|uniref:Serine protease n=1 Tax=Fluctibacter halophilus TaxID=226011 RepID=A0ABS8G2Z6_9ALTE|nr:serine protease [Aestuariibacter halophilus]MCC2614905.1 serine protease [Aestuariibacter halophilus]